MYELKYLSLIKKSFLILSSLTFFFEIYIIAFLEPNNTNLIYFISILWLFIFCTIFLIVMFFEEFVLKKYINKFLINSNLLISLGLSFLIIYFLYFYITSQLNFLNFFILILAFSLYIFWMYY